MNKLITILFLFAFTVNAQFQLEEDWRFKTDKQLHVIAGNVITTSTFLYIYAKTEDEEWSRHVAIFVGVSSGGCKEFIDIMQDKEVMLSDILYTAIGSIATGWACYGIAKWRKKRIQKKNMKLF